MTKKKTVKKTVKTSKTTNRTAAGTATTTKKKRVSNIDAIYNVIEKSALKGMTCAEVERRLSLPHNTVSGRIAELVREGGDYNNGSVVQNGQYRKNAKTGRMAIVWFAHSFIY